MPSVLRAGPPPRRTTGPRSMPKMFQGGIAHGLTEPGGAWSFGPQRCMDASAVPLTDRTLNAPTLRPGDRIGRRMWA